MWYYSSSNEALQASLEDVGSIVQTFALKKQRCWIKLNSIIRSNSNGPAMAWPAPFLGSRPHDAPAAPGDDMFLELPQLIQDGLVGGLDTIHLQDEILGRGQQRCFV